MDFSQIGFYSTCTEFVDGATTTITCYDPFKAFFVQIILIGIFFYTMFRIYKLFR